MGTNASTRKPAASGIGSALRIKVELWLAVVFMMLAFGAGIVVRGMSEQPAQPAVGVAPVGQLPVAPPLTQEQIEQGLPPGHPDLGSVQGNGGGKEAKGKPSPSQSPASAPESP